MKQGTGSKRVTGGGVRKYPLSDSQKSSIGQAQIAAAANHQEGSTAQDRKTRGNSSHVPEKDKYTCAVCNSKLVNKPDLIAQHEASKKHRDAVAAAAAAAKRRWHCDTCNEDFQNTPDAVAAHMSSNEHLRMRRYDAEENRDGSILANKQRQMNGDAAANAAKQQKK